MWLLVGLAAVAALTLGLLLFATLDALGAVDGEPRATAAKRPAYGPPIDADLNRRHRVRARNFWPGF